MENVSKRIANRVAYNQNLDKEKEGVIAYGTFVLLQTLVSLILVSIIGAIFGLAKEALIIMITASVFRKYTGGAHATSPARCIAIGVVICIFKAIIIEYICGMYNNKLIISICVLISIIAYYFVYRHAPVESKVKPLNDEKKKRMKKGAIKILNIFSIVGLIFIIFAICVSREFSYLLLSMYAGILWQIFTMTDFGHLFIINIDLLLKNIFQRRVGNEKNQ